jgi:hypothetical protein
MKKLAAVLGFAVLLGAGVAHAGTTAPVSKEAVLKAITVFQEDPSSQQGSEASETILAFARSSDAVHISLSHDVVPWMKKSDAPDADTRTMLLAAYVAGNVSSQLKSGRVHDDIYAGWEQVLTTYAQLLAINPAAKISEVNELKSKEAAGKLQAYAAEIGGK